MNDHYSADETPKPPEPVEINEARPIHGRSKGRKFETFTLPSKEVVTIMYVSEDVLSYYSKGKEKSFYTQVAGKEFRSDDPKLIPPAVRKYLETYKPIEFVEMILVSRYHSYGNHRNDSVEAFGTYFSRIMHGVRGDGARVVRDGDHERKMEFDRSDTLIPYTKERWDRIKATARLEDRLNKQMKKFVTLEAPAMIEHLDSKPVLDPGPCEDPVDALWGDDDK